MCCNKNYHHKFGKKLKKRFFNTYRFSNHDNNKVILSLRKGVYPFEYIDDWEKFNKTMLPEKEDFHSHLNMEDVTYADHVHAKKFVKMLADVFGNFRNMHIKIYKLDPAKFLLAP